MDFFFSTYSTSIVFAGLMLDPSSRPVTCAPRRAGSTWAFENKKLSRLSLSEGGSPRTTAAMDAVIEEEDAMGAEGGTLGFRIFLVDWIVAAR